MPEDDHVTVDPLADADPGVRRGFEEIQLDALEDDKAGTVTVFDPDQDTTSRWITSDIAIKPGEIQ